MHIIIYAALVLTGLLLGLALSALLIMNGGNETAEELHHLRTAESA